MPVLSLYFKTSKWVWSSDSRNDGWPADNYDDGYLAGACVGDLVFSDDEVLVSEQTITGWYEEETQDNYRKELDVRDIANIVYYELILNRLALYNQSRKNIQWMECQVSDRYLAIVSLAKLFQSSFLEVHRNQDRRINHINTEQRIKPHF